MIRRGEIVIASVAPSFSANFGGVSIESMRAALGRLGFNGASETAIGATVVKREYEHMMASDSRNVVISSCCHSVNLLIRKYFPEALPCPCSLADEGPLCRYKGGKTGREDRIHRALHIEKIRSRTVSGDGRLRAHVRRAVVVV